jgi:N-methylhydantoinase B
MDTAPNSPAESAHFNPLTVQIWGSMLASAAEEMGATLERTAYSPNIKERLDHSCAIFDSYGRLLAQAAHIPVHLGAMPLMMQSLINIADWSPGCMWVCNSPHYGGTHLPDITVVAPIYAQFDANMPEELIGFAASRAHHADIGGMAPGSLPLSSELYQEGLVLPPLQIVLGGKVQEPILNLICANSRTPSERRGDIQAQIAANNTGGDRLRKLALNRGKSAFEAANNEVLNYSAALIRSAITRLPAGTYCAEDRLDNVPLNGNTPEVFIRLCVTVEPEGTILFDFTGSTAQVKAPLNATRAITWSACCYAVRCLAGEGQELPTNEGCFYPVRIVVPEGSVVNADYGSAVAAGNVETSQRITDTIFAALSSAAPNLFPAASQGTMNNLTIGGFDIHRGQPFAYYETIGGGAGASADSRGASAIQCHMTNTRNTPTESLESHYPIRVLEYSVRRGSGGYGCQRGGDGITRRIELLADCTVSLLADRRELPPPGADGGESAACGKDTWLHRNGMLEEVPGRFTRSGKAGDQICIQTPGGGGYGPAASESQSSRA